MFNPANGFTSRFHIIMKSFGNMGDFLFLLFMRFFQQRSLCRPRRWGNSLLAQSVPHRLVDRGLLGCASTLFFWQTTQTI